MSQSTDNVSMKQDMAQQYVAAEERLADRLNALKGHISYDLREKIECVQQHWSNYRDAAADFAFHYEGEATNASLSALVVRVEITDRRIDEIDVYLKEIDL